MKINNFKHINELKFTFREKMFFYSKNPLFNRDLIEFLESLLKGKKVTEFLKIEDNDFLQIQKNSQVIIVPSFFEFEKTIMSGQKSLINQIVKNVIEQNKYINETINTIKNLFSTFDIRTEFNLIDKIFEEINNKLNLEIELEILENIEEYISNSLKVSIFKGEINIDNSNINFNDLKILYIKLIKWLIRISDDHIWLIFDDIFYGLDFEEIKQIQTELEEIKTFIAVSTFLPIINEDDIKNLIIFENNKTYDMGELINCKDEYVYYIQNENDFFEKLKIIIFEWLKLSTIYGLQWKTFINIDKDSENLLSAYINRIF